MNKLLDDVISNLIASSVCAFFGFIVSVIVKAMNSEDEEETFRKRAKYSHKLVKTQFYVCLVALPISVTVGFLIPSSLLGDTLLRIALMFAKVACFIIAFYSFIFAWGAFSAAFEFYPKDIPTKDGAGSTDAPRPDESPEVVPDNATDDNARKNTQRT